MRKLYKLKKWYSLDDAAKRLSLTLDEPIEVQDIRQLMAEGEIAAYWNIDDMHAREIAPVANFYRAGDAMFDIYKDMKTIPDSCELMIINEFERQTEYVQKISGLFKIDIENIGAAKSWLTSIAARKESGYTSLDGTILVGEDEKLWQIVESFPNLGKDSKLKKPWSNHENFYPSFQLPEEFDIVISKSELEKFEAQLLEPEIEKPLSPRERNTLLKIIAALCKAQELNLSKPYKAAEIIKSNIELMGNSMSIANIAGKLEQARKS